MNTDVGKTLMLRFQETGDRAACQELFELFRLPLWRFVLRLSGSEHDADDLSQRTWLKLLDIAERRVYRDKNRATFRTYLFTIARNLVIDEGRAMRSTATHVDYENEADALLSHDPTPEHAVDAILTKEELRRAMNDLPLEQREVLAMWAEGFGFAEIATVVGVSRNTVIGRKRYGIEKLRAAAHRIPSDTTERK